MCTQADWYRECLEDAQPGVWMYRFYTQWRLKVNFFTRHNLHAGIFPLMGIVVSRVCNKKLGDLKFANGAPRPCHLLINLSYINIILGEKCNYSTNFCAQMAHLSAKGNTIILFGTAPRQLNRARAACRRRLRIGWDRTRSVSAVLIVDILGAGACSPAVFKSDKLLVSIILSLTCTV